jgi:DNA-binding transcriptional ArsR family regulator
MAEPVDGAVLEALSHPLRLALLVALERDGERTAAELAADLAISEGAVHQQIAALHELGLVVDGTTSRHVRVHGPGWASVAAQLRALQRTHEQLPPVDRDR